ncbi:MAG: bifunctional D-glycero-beta-D-manno-heptose-7-phosphate kinase/D-glycero-beta-D-manno-heptose 1-phosphate adenylyltransferase HldE [Halioglobus sp.]
MESQLPDFDRARVLVVGDIMLDRYCEGEVSRVSPEAPVPVVTVDSLRDRPGGAGNVALAIAALGAHVRLIGQTGDDPDATTLVSMLEAAGVTCGIERLAGRDTTVKLRVIARRQQLLRLDFERAPEAAFDPMPLAAPGGRLAACTALVLSDYAKGVLHDPQPLIRAARAARVPVLVDPKGPDFTRYRGATLLTPNLREFEAVTGVCATEAELEAHARTLVADLQLEALLVTRAERGMTLVRADGEALHLPAREREVFDVTGAGDTVIGVLAAALAAGADLREATVLANIGAGLAVGRFGAVAISAPELRQALAGEAGPERGVVSLEQLQAALSQARARGERVVFTNGCFDLLHAGHVSYLEQARRMGDRLVVAVNGDASLARLKGPGRPLNAQHRRMAVLAGLAAVDWVVGFDDDTPEALLQLLQPEVLVKGGDYARKEEIVGWQIVEAYGGEVRIAEQLPGASTSALVDSIIGGSKY